MKWGTCWTGPGGLLEVGDGYDQDTLDKYMKPSVNKLKYFLQEEKRSSWILQVAPP